MGNDVFANGREIACKAADGKSICAFPDVCFTPPQSPATPPGVPIPYPNTGLARDTMSGSRTVKISGKEVMLKNKSYFKKSLGDEAGCAPKKGILTNVNRGKVYFTSWSMDVKYEGANVVRHMDLTTHNHGSGPNTLLWPYIDTDTISAEHPCHRYVIKEREACAGARPKMKFDKKYGTVSQKGVKCTKACRRARACVLPRYRDAAKICCHPNTTGDHIVEVSCFVAYRKGLDHLEKVDLTLDELSEKLGGGDLILPKGVAKTTPRMYPGFHKYNIGNAPTACAARQRGGSNHSRMNELRDGIKRNKRREKQEKKLDKTFSYEFTYESEDWDEHPWDIVVSDAKLSDAESWWTYDEAADAGVESHQSENKRCNPRCTRAQLDNYHHSILPGESPKEKNKLPVATYIPGK